ncbi:hypothetical protein ScalyP_jg6397 [Parmales sp. scaly parma]|mgnify:CR=1 FL=1|nr:hypothetical protein ScalyP_jg6397 [Parmales sp. scaly parma]
MVLQYLSLLLLTTTIRAIRLPRITPPTLPVTYSNPTGSTLTPIRPNVYLAERPFFPTLPGLRKTDVACKMAVVKLQTGGLWVHSPVELTSDLCLALAELGPVTHIVTPNTEHQKFAPSWIAAFPDATSYCCPSLAAKKPDVWDYTIGADETPPPEWPCEIVFISLHDVEAVPIINKSFFNEVVFYHNLSNTLFLTDLFWNYPSDAPRRTLVWKAAMDKVYRPLYNSLMQKENFAKTIAKICALDFTYISVCHGEPIEGSPARMRQTLKEHLSTG